MKDKKPLCGVFCKYYWQNFVVVGFFFFLKNIDEFN